MNDEFLTEVISEFSQYNPFDCTDIAEIPSLQIVEISSTDAVASPIEKNVLKQMWNSDDLFLLKAFENYVPFDSLGHVMVDGKRDDERSTFTNQSLDLYEKQVVDEFTD